MNDTIMKSIKLLAAFLIILGSVVGILFLTRYIDEKKKLPIPEVDKYELYRKLIETEWSEAVDWNESLFLSHCDLVNQLSSKMQNVEPLRDLVTFNAIEIVSDKIFAAWASSTCKKSTVDKYVNAVSIICRKDSKAKNNPAVKEIQKVSAVYKKAYEMAYQTISMSPTFDGSSWSSFDSYSSKILSDRDAMLNNTIYKNYLANITELKSRFTSIPDVLSKARADFYNELASEIVAFYGNIPKESRTQDQLKQLRNVRDTYEKEYCTSPLINDCAKQFNIDVQNNEPSIW